jgi:hypothetical protein
MRYARALGGGTIGAAAAIAVMWLAGRLFGVAADPAAVLGALLPGAAVPRWMAGALVELAVGAAAAILYALLFERVARRATWWLGAAIGVGHGVAAGLIVGVATALLPADVAELAPGAFVSYHGVAAALTFVAAHLVYGAIVGATYGAVRHPPPGASLVHWREVYPAPRR